MTKRLSLLCGATVAGAALCALISAISAVGQTMKQPPLVRIAELEIDPSQLMPYKHALSDEIATSIRVEPGVLNLYAVSVKDHPNQVRIFELYKDQAAYDSHLLTPHFRKYKETTRGMVETLKLVETEPIMLGSK
jgi:quinol monooxygenase YgiN